MSVVLNPFTSELELISSSGGGGGGVSLINGLSGSVTLAPAGNITLTPSGNTINISAIDYQVLVDSEISVPLTGPVGLVIDGVTITTGSTPSILLREQSPDTQNGVYNYSDNGTTYTLTLSPTFNVAVGSRVFVTSGTQNTGNMFIISSLVDHTHFVINGFKASSVPFPLIPYADNIITLGNLSDSWNNVYSYAYQTVYNGTVNGYMYSDGSNFWLGTNNQQLNIIDDAVNTQITMGTGNATGSDGSSIITFFTGSTVDGTAGKIRFFAGAASGAGNGADINLFSGYSVTGQAGNHNIGAGTATSNPGGDPTQGTINLSTDGYVNIYSEGASTTPTYIPSLRFYESTDTYFVGLQASDSLAASTTWVLPLADGIVNQALTTDGAGNLSFASTLDIHAINGTTTTGGATTAVFTNVPTGATTPSGYLEITINGTLSYIPYFQ
jgi:hypothetical protein